MILIVSVAGDFHTHAVVGALRNLGYDQVHVFECDRISGRESISWEFPASEGSAVRAADGVRVPLDAVDLIWWRRVNADQAATQDASSDHERSLVNHDCRGSLSGVLAASFAGEWLSDPRATTQAGDKIYQLTVAGQAGFRVPRTLVSQAKEEVLDFAARVDRLIVKPVVGAPGPIMFTQFGDDLADIPPESFRTSPAVFQEYIPGDRHIRLNCFGDEMHAAMIESSALDWRPDLSVPISRWEVPDGLRGQVLDALRRLGLRMGVIDLKLTPEGEPVWLEVNPQGQFLFLEPLLKLPLAEIFASFLIRSARSGLVVEQVPR